MSKSALTIGMNYDDSVYGDARFENAGIPLLNLGYASRQFHDAFSLLPDNWINAPSVNAEDIRRDPSVADLKSWRDEWVEHISSDQSDLAIIYYAGHGVQIGGRQYIIGPEPSLIDFQELVRPALQARGEQRKPQIVVFFDACRIAQPRDLINLPILRIDDNFEGGGVSGGDAAAISFMDLSTPGGRAPDCVAVLCSVLAGQQASTGDENLTPFTRALITGLSNNLSLAELFLAIGEACRRADVQVPAHYWALDGNPYLRGRPNPFGPGRDAPLLFPG